MKLDLMKLGIFCYFILYTDVMSVPIKERTIMIGMVAIGFFVDWYMIKFWVEFYWRKYLKKKK